jgi:hypothetical protein
MQNTLKDRVKKIIEEIESLDLNDPTIVNYWERLTMILSENEKSTIGFLEDCEDDNTIIHVASVFDDVSNVLKSKEFVECLVRLNGKYPHLNLSYVVNIAKDSIDEELQ